MKNRRDFIKNMAGATALACCGSGISLLMQSCTTVNKIQGKIIDNIITVSKSDFMENKFLIVNNLDLKAPIYLIKDNNDGYNAFLMLCTHRDCALTPTGSFMTCPCHGSEFSNQGKVLQGPAEKTLTEYNVTVLETTVNIELNNKIAS